MKNKLIEKLFRFLGQQILPRFARRFSGKPKFSKTNKDKKASFALKKHLPKVFGFLKNRFRQRA